MKKRTFAQRLTPAFAARCTGFAALAASLLLFLLPTCPLAAQEDPDFCSNLLESAERALKRRDYNGAREYVEAALPLCQNNNDSLRSINKRIVLAIEHEKKTAEASDDASHNIVRAMQVARSAPVRSMRLHEYNYYAHLGNFGATLAFKEAAAAHPRFSSTVIKEHSDWVGAVAWSPDGKLLASASADSTVKVWSLSEKRVQHTFVGHAGGVWAVAWSPDGKQIASASRDGVVKVWDVSAKRESHHLPAHTGAVWSVSWSPDGKLLASASADGTVKIWDWAARRTLNTLEDHTGEATAVSWSPDGKLLASASTDRTVKVWNWAEEQALHTFPGHNQEASSVAWSPDGRYIASASLDGTVKVWDWDEKRERQTLKGHTDRVRSVAWSPDSKRLASSSSDGSVKIWDWDDGKMLHNLKEDQATLEDHPVRFWCVAWSPNGQHLAGATSDHTVKLWDLEGQQAWLTFKGHSDAVNAVAWSPNSQLVVSASSDQTLKVWNVAPNQQERPRTMPGRAGPVYAVVWSPDGQHFASAGEDGTIKVWSLAKGDTVSVLRRGDLGAIYALAWSPDGRHLACASVWGDVQIWDWEAKQSRYSNRWHWDRINALAWSPDSQYLASASGDGSIRVEDWASRRSQASLWEGGNPQNSVAWSPDGKRLVSTADDGSVQIRDWETAQVLLTLRVESGKAWSAVWSPDGHQVASASRDSIIKVWDLATQQPLFILEGHAGRITAVSWSPDGRYLASASTDQSLKVWAVRPYLADKFDIYAPAELLRHANARLQHTDLDTLSSAVDIEKAAVLFEEAGREEQALTFFERAVKQEGQQGSSLLFKICVLSEKLGEPFDHARFDAVEAPDDKAKIARFYEQRGEVERALVFYEKASRQRQETEWLFKVFRLSENLGRPFDQARFDGFESADANSEIARFYENRKEGEKALKFYEKAYGQRQQLDWLFNIYNLSEQLQQHFGPERFDIFTGAIENQEIARFLYERKRAPVQALYFYQKALAAAPSSSLINRVAALSEELGQPFDPDTLPHEDAAACDALAGYYEGKKEWAKALRYARIAATNAPGFNRKAKVIELEELAGQPPGLSQPIDTEMLQSIAGRFYRNEHWAAAEKAYLQLLERENRPAYRHLIFATQWRQGKEGIGTLLETEHLETLREHYDWLSQEAVYMRADTLPLLSWQEKTVLIGERLLLKTPEDRSLQKGLSLQYNNIAWFSLFKGRYVEADSALARGVELDKDNLFLYTNIPFALLFQGRFDEAMREIDKWKDKPYAPERNLPTFRDIYLLDIERFEKAYAIPPERREDIEKIRTHLRGEASTTSSSD